MKTKLIGVTPRILHEDGVEKEFVNKRYMTPLTERGFNVIMLTTDNPNIEEILNLCDGFLITGGADINPKYFNEENRGESKNVIDRLDEVDKAVVDHAVKNKKPVLGICRGHQAINVFLGGTLYQDIGQDHSKIKDNHEVKTIKNNFINFDKNIKTNSYHHQAIKDVAPNLEVIAWHTDGTIEAVVHRNLPIFGIQWHPEAMTKAKESQLIFDHFLGLFAK